MANAGSVISGRTFKLWYKAWNSINALPANTVDWGAAITGFTDVGYTNGGLAFGVDVSRNEIRVDQEYYPVYNPIVEANVTLNTELAEMTPANLKLATGLGTLTTVAPVGATRGYDDLDITSSFTDNFNTFLADVKQPDGMPFRIALWKALATGATDTTFDPENAATIGLELTGQVDSSTTPSRIGTVRDVLPGS